MKLNQVMYVIQVYSSLALMLSAIVAVGFAVSHAMITPDQVLAVLNK
jgi:hypothetical protein